MTNAKTDMLRLTVGAFLDGVAARTPTPGGGAVAAAAGALAVSMARMVTAYSAGDKTPADKRKLVDASSSRLRKAGDMLRELIAEDATAYEVMTRLAAHKSEEPETYQAAVVTAASVPLQMAALAAQVLAELDSFKSLSSRYLISDLGVAAVLAEATARAAAYSVRINLPELTEDKTRKKLQRDLTDILSHCAMRQQAILSFVDDRMAAGS